MVSEYIKNNCKWEFKNIYAMEMKGKTWSDVNEYWVKCACNANTYDEALHYYLLSLR